MLTRFLSKSLFENQNKSLVADKKCMKALDLLGKESVP